MEDEGGAVRGGCPHRALLLVAHQWLLDARARPRRRCLRRLRRCAIAGRRRTRWASAFPTRGARSRSTWATAHAPTAARPPPVCFSRAATHTRIAGSCGGLNAAPWRTCGGHGLHEALPPRATCHASTVNVNPTWNPLSFCAGRGHRKRPWRATVRRVHRGERVQGADGARRTARYRILARGDDVRW